ncbi:MAG: DUF2232 domain-containing protein [Gammaproteobacteria bacterium]
MKALAEYIVRGRWQAVLVTAACGAMTFMLPPFSTMLNYLAAAAVALVTLHIGLLQGLQVLLVAAVISVLLYQLLGLQFALVAVMVVVLWLPCWALAAVLRTTNRLDRVLMAAALFGVTILFVVYGLYGDPVPWWTERLQALQVMLDSHGLAVTNLSDPDMLHDVAALMTGLVLASLLIGVLGSLMLARWWQSRLVHPGAFGDEFCSLRLGYQAGLLTLAVMLAARFVSGTSGELIAQLAMIMLVPYLLIGLAVIHSLVRQTERSSAWLAAIYVLLALIPQATLLLAGGGLLDTWVDFRRRVRAKGSSDGK